MFKPKENFTKIYPKQSYGKPHSVDMSCTSSITLACLFSPLYLFMGLSITKVCPLYNLITVRDISTKLLTFVRHIQTTCHAQKYTCIHVYFSNYNLCNITKCNFVTFLFLNWGGICFSLKNNCGYLLFLVALFPSLKQIVSIYQHVPRHKNSILLMLLKLNIYSNCRNNHCFSCYNLDITIHLLLKT